MNWTIEEIRKALGDKLVGKLPVKKIICRALLPPEIIEHICSRVWFISSSDDAWAFTFRGSEIKERHLIFLSDELFTQAEEEIIYTILHEVGHVMLNHRNSIGIEQTETEIKLQEREANKFAQKYV